MRMRLLCLVLALVLAVSLCACGGNAGNTTEASTTQTTTAATTAATQPDDGKVTYTITVTDEAGNPMAGVMTQICLDTCLPGVTNANGVATFKVVEADYKASIPAPPEGYAPVSDTYFDGGYDLTLVLKAAA